MSTPDVTGSADDLPRRRRRSVAHDGDGGPWAVTPDGAGPDEAPGAEAPEGSTAPLRRRRAERVVGMTTLDGGTPVAEDGPSRPRDGLTGLAMTGAMPLDGGWLGVDPGVPVSGAPLAAADPRLDVPLDPAPFAAATDASTHAATNASTDMATDDARRAGYDVDAGVDDAGAHWTTVPDETPVAAGSAARGRPDAARGLTVVDLASLERQTGPQAPSASGYGTAFPPDPAEGFTRPAAEPTYGPSFDTPAPWEAPLGGEPPTFDPADPLGDRPPHAAASGSAPLPPVGAPVVPPSVSAQPPVGAPGPGYAPSTGFAPSTDWGSAFTAQDPRAAAEWWGTSTTPGAPSHPLAGVPSPSPVPLASAPIPVRRPDGPTAGAATGPVTASLPTTPRPDGEDPRTGAIRLAAAVAGDATGRRRILSTGPISFDVDDDEPARGRFEGATRPLRRRRPAGQAPDAARSPLTPPTPADGLAARPDAPLTVPAGRSSRAGRNLPAAIGIGLLLAGTVLASLLFRKEAFVGVVCAAAVLAVWELATVLTVKRIHIPVIPLAVGSLGMLVSAFVAREEGLLVSFTLTAFGVLLWRIIDGIDGAARDVAAAVFTAAYVPFLAGFSIVMLAAPDGAMRVLIFIAVVVASDVGGYTAGVLFGKHPMAPTVSPKKSWEGFGGSVVLAMAVAVAGVVYLLHGPWWAGLAVGAAAATTATLGDLSESLLKRDLGVKDMGNLLPGHGGMMDRLDSLLPTAPAVYLILLLLVPSVS